MYSAEAFRSKLEVVPSEISTHDAIFLREMLAAIEQEGERLYSAGSKGYRLNLVGATLAPHGRRQTLRVRVTFERAEGEQRDGQEETDLERITFTYTFSPQRSPEANLRHFRRYIAKRAVALAGVESKPRLIAASTRPSPEETYNGAWARRAREYLRDLARLPDRLGPSSALELERVRDCHRHIRTRLSRNGDGDGLSAKICWGDYLLRLSSVR